VSWSSQSDWIKKGGKIMKRPGLSQALASSLLAVLACGCAPADREAIGSAVSEWNNGNSLHPEALDLVALNLGALNLGALDVNAMDATTLGAIRDPGTNGTLARQLVSYAANCALNSSQSFDFAWTDSQGAVHQESYPGSGALATSWATQPLDAAGQQWVSACLISRTNYLGVVVSLSSRGNAPGLATTPAEVAAYGNEEGAFWGNLFGAAPYAYACDNIADDANSRSLSRFCAAGYVDAQGGLQSCGMIQRLGSCAAVCAPLITPSGGGGQYHPVCDAHGYQAGLVDSSATTEAITVFLD
jgi:hypothetical protein